MQVRYGWFIPSTLKARLTDFVATAVLRKPLCGGGLQRVLLSAMLVACIRKRGTQLAQQILSAHQVWLPALLGIHTSKRRQSRTLPSRPPQEQHMLRRTKHRRDRALVEGDVMGREVLMDAVAALLTTTESQRAPA